MPAAACDVDSANILQRSRLKELSAVSKFEEGPAGALPLQMKRRKAGELHLSQLIWPEEGQKKAKLCAMVAYIWKETWQFLVVKLRTSLRFWAISAPPMRFVACCCAFRKAESISNSFSNALSCKHRTASLTHHAQFSPAVFFLGTLHSFFTRSTSSSMASARDLSLPTIAISTSRIFDNGFSTLSRKIQFRSGFVSRWLTGSICIASVTSSM